MPNVANSDIKLQLRHGPDGARYKRESLYWFHTLAQSNAVNLEPRSNLRVGGIGRNFRSSGCSLGSRGSLAHFAQLGGGYSSIDRGCDEGKKSTPSHEPSGDLYRSLCGDTLWVIGTYFGYKVFIAGSGNDQILRGIFLVLGGSLCIMFGTMLVLDCFFDIRQVFSEQTCESSNPWRQIHSIVIVPAK